MASLNRATLIGYVGADPEVRDVNDSTVAHLRIATNQRWTDRNGEKHERTDWHTIVVWGQPAQFCRDYVRKGHALYVEGPIHVRAWDDKDGVKRYATAIAARNLQLLDRKDQSPGPDEEAPADDPVGDIWPELKN
jgi:single-strand DNA-binding protein